MTTDKRYITAYRVLITLIGILFFYSGYLEVTKNPLTYPKTLSMGYPAYFITTLGIAKICGAITLALPKLRKVKEWVLIGFIFDVIFAFISGFATNLLSDCIKASIAFIFLTVTYFLFAKIHAAQNELFR